MLLVAGILLLIIGTTLFLMIAFAEGMSDRQVSTAEFWTGQFPALIVLALAVACFVARHYLHGHAITW